jgi:DMSO/TMAO reductase YedYZ molybdopterin-dependent catalytic subunit
MGFPNIAQRVRRILCCPESRRYNRERRVFLRLSLSAGLLAAAPSTLKAFFESRFPVRSVENENFRFDPPTGLIKWKDKPAGEPYRLSIDGLVEKPVNLTYGDLKGLPQVNQTSDFHCVEGWSVQDVKWGGFRFAEILKRVKVRPEAKYAVFHALGKTDSAPENLDHYRESLPIPELLDPKKECLLALSMDGKPLTHDHGAPLRVVSPFNLGYKGAKFVSRIEFSADQPPGWWTLANPIYPVTAPVPGNRLRRRKPSPAS